MITVKLVCEKQELGKSLKCRLFVPGESLQFGKPGGVIEKRFCR
jgi:hypothetical protein